MEETIRELWKHAKVSIDNKHYCKDGTEKCYCCKCLDEYRKRKGITRRKREVL